MLEFKMKETKNAWGQTFFGDRDPVHLNFKNCYYRIDNVVYDGYTEEFNEIAMKAKFLEILKK